MKTRAVWLEYVAFRGLQSDELFVRVLSMFSSQSTLCTPCMKNQKSVPLCALPSDSVWTCQMAVCIIRHHLARAFGLCTSRDEKFLETASLAFALAFAFAFTFAFG